MNDKKEIEDFASRLAGAIKVACGSDIPNNAMQVALKASLDYERLEITPIDKWQPIETALKVRKPFLMYVPAYEHPIVMGWGQNVDLRPTHWQPGPEVPKGSYHDK